MTSKISFSKLLKEDFRHRLWVPSLACVVFFLSVVEVAMAMQNMDVDDLAYVKTFISTENFWITFVSIVGATICGLESFSYLFRKQKVDFYHSLPVKRGKLFVVRYVNGLLFYAIPALIYTLAAVSVSAAAGFSWGSLIGAGMKGYIQNLVIFLMFYHTAMLGAMLCGTVLVAGTGYVVLAVAGVALAELIPAYVMNYFTSYYAFKGGFLTWFNYISPVYWMSSLLDCGPGAYVGSLILAIVIWLIVFRLYLIRPSEAAEKAIAFNKIRSALRILVVVPCALYVGLLFYDTATGYKDAWAMAGVVIFLILLHGITEVIFDFDIKSAFKHKKQLIICILFCLAFNGFFILDPMGIDSRIPEKDAVKAVYLDPEDIFTVSCYDTETKVVTDQTNYHLEHSVLKGEELDSFYKLMEYALPPHAVDTNDEEPYWEAAWDKIIVRFVKKNGASEYRTYYINVDGKQEMENVFSYEDYRHSLYQIYDEDYSNVVSSCSVYIGDFSKRADITSGGAITDKSVLQELITAYQEDLDDLSFETLHQYSFDNEPVYTLEFALVDEDQSASYPVYEGFTHTISLLENMANK